MKFRSNLRFAGSLMGLAIILACGGSGADVHGNTYPLTSSITVEGVNNDNQNVHILIGGEAFDPGVNRLTPGASNSRSSPLSYRWDSGTDTVDLTVFAGRNGATFAQGTVTLTGDERMIGTRVRAVFAADQSLTVTKVR